MKMIHNLYPEIISKKNLYRSAHLAAQGRRYRDSVADFNFFLEREMETLHRELAEKTYRHGKYRMFTIYDPKERNIAAAPFRDRVVHHAVHDVIEPFLDKTFIHDSYACRKDKGTHKAVDRAQSFLRANRFCLHGDIKKYFPSMDHGILKKMLVKRTTDKDLLWLVNGIIDSAVAVNGLTGARVSEFSSERVNGFNPQTGVPANQPRGLPIGNLTSQFFANLYLNELDYFVKFELRCRYYLRYMDDFLVFANDKAELNEIKIKIRDFLKTRLALDLHEGKSQVYKTSGGVKFLGFRIYKDHRRLASDNVRRFRKRLKKFDFNLENGTVSAEKISDSVRCWTAHSRYADTKGLRLRLFKGFEAKDKRFAGLLQKVLLQGSVRPGSADSPINRCCRIDGRS
ncbi:MAG: reverse transcriptase/maturase family protein [Candidatus Omnitrophota bacterium]